MDNDQQLHTSNSTDKYIVLDEQEFEQLFRQYFIKLCAFCQYKYGLDIDTAKEMVHAGFIKLWQNRQSCTTELSARSYLFRIIMNQCLDHLKHHAVRKRYEQYVYSMPQTERMQNGVESIDVKELQSAVAAAVAELPEQMKLIFTLSRFEGLKYGEIAERLNISVKTVETQMSRALSKLRTSLQDYLIITLLLLLQKIFFLIVGVNYSSIV